LCCFFSQKKSLAVYLLSKKEFSRDKANFSAGFSESEVVAHDHQTSTLRKETMECLDMERRCQHHLHHVKRSSWQTSALPFVFTSKNVFSPQFAMLTLAKRDKQP
jgi:hypothetical protein